MNNGGPQSFSHVLKDSFLKRQWITKGIGNSKRVFWSFRKPSHMGFFFFTPPVILMRLR